MRPKRDSSNVSNFFLIIGQLRYHFPKTNENTILGKLLRKAKGSESGVVEWQKIFICIHDYMGPGYVGAACCTILCSGGP